MELDPHTPPSEESWLEFLNQMSKAFEKNDNERYFLERNLGVMAVKLEDAIETQGMTEELHRAIHENTKDIIFTGDVEGLIYFLNPTARELQNEGFQNMRAFHFVAEKDRQEFIHAYDRVFQSGKNQHVDLCAQMQDGTLRSYSIDLAPLRKNGQVILVACIARDTTNTKELNVERQGLLSLLDQTGLSVLTIHSNGNVIDANENALKMLGYTREELMGGSIGELEMTGPNIHWSENSVSDRTEVRRETVRETGVYRKKDGSLLNVMLTVTEKTLERQQCYFLILESVGESIPTGNHSMPAQALYDARMASIGKMASHIAHEISNPITVIQEFSSQLQGSLNAVHLSPLAALTAKIEFQASRASNIVKSLQNLSRDGSLDPMIEIDLNPVVADVMEMCREKFKMNSVLLRKGEALAQGVRVKGRPVQISQLLLNLLNNAFDAVQNSSEKWVQIDTVNKGTAVELWVTNSGTRIPEALRKKILQPLPYTTKPPGKGTGLGLKICQDIIASHGGSLSIDPKHPHTRFIARFLAR